MKGRARHSLWSIFPELIITGLLQFMVMWNTHLRKSLVKAPQTMIACCNVLQVKPRERRDSEIRCLPGVSWLFYYVSTSDATSLFGLCYWDEVQENQFHLHVNLLQFAYKDSALPPCIDQSDWSHGKHKANNHLQRTAFPPFWLFLNLDNSGMCATCSHLCKQIVLKT